MGGLGFDLIWKACGAHNIRLIPAHDIMCRTGRGAGKTDEEAQKTRSAVKTRLSSAS